MTIFDITHDWQFHRATDIVTENGVDWVDPMLLTVCVGRRYYPVTWLPDTQRETEEFFKRRSLVQRDIDSGTRLAPDFMYVD